MNEDAARTIMARLGINVTAKSATGWLQAQCPLAPWTHQRGTDHNPAFAIMVCDDGPSHYKCLACKYKGRVAQLVRTLETYRDQDYPGLALEADMADMAGAFGGGFDVAKQMAGYEEPEPIDETAIRGLYPPAYSVHAAAKFLDHRGISKHTAETLELQFDPDQHRVLFPVRGQRGELYGISGRSILEEHEFPRKSYAKVKDYLGLPKRALLLGMHLYQPGKPMWVTEGLIGYARHVEMGLREVCNPVALLGSEMTPQKATLLAGLDERVYLMTDPDAAGEACLWGTWNKETQDHDGDGAVSRLRKKGLAVFVPEWPEGISDPDDIHLRHARHILDNCPLYLDPT